MASAFVELHPNDDVWIVLRDVPAGSVAPDGVTVSTDIASGHKVARRAVPKGRPVHRYNQVIGVASADIAPGDHVHVHNLAMGEVALDHAFCADAKPTPFVAEPRTFLGIRRADGRVATRNYIGVLSSVNCSATAAKMIADHYRGRLADYPNVDGVVALTHKSGSSPSTARPG